MNFSIIIPAKNEQKNIRDCLLSLNALTYPKDDYEVILIDNGSTDETVHLARQYGAKVFIQPDLKISGLRNFGAQQSTGKILAFLDADCTVFPNWLSAASKWMDNLDICCYGSPPEIPEQATWVQKSWFMVRNKKEPVVDVEWLESMNMFVRKDVFLKVSGFDESLTTCEDYDLSVRLKDHGRIVADKNIRAIHHGEAASLRHFYKKESWRGTSNITGMRRHGFHLRELPSLAMPFVHLFCLLIALVLLILVPQMGFSALVIWLLLWQGTLLGLSFYKGQYLGSLKSIMGLFVLLNVYFFARARAMLRFSLEKK